jgi:hypothetical protein
MHIYEFFFKPFHVAIGLPEMGLLLNRASWSKNERWEPIGYYSNILTASKFSPDKRAMCGMYLTIQNFF